MAVCIDASYPCEEVAVCNTIISGNALKDHVMQFCAAYDIAHFNAFR